jgi:hypothetical protein
MTKNLNLNITLWVPTIIITLLLSISYIIQVGALSQEIYLTQSYREKLSVLSENNKLLDISFSKMDSLSNIDEHINGSRFVKSENIKYVRVLDGSVASVSH